MPEADELEPGHQRNFLLGGIVARLGFGWRAVADRLEEAAVTEPVDPLQGGELDGLEVAPGTTPLDHLCLEQADDGLDQRIDAPMLVKSSPRWLALACRDGGRPRAQHGV